MVERRVAVRVAAEEVLVEPHLGIHVDALELDQHRLGVGGRGAPRIPAAAGREVAAVAAGRARLTALELDAPVVWEIDGPPLAVVEPVLPRSAGNGPEQEAPPLVEVESSHLVLPFT